MSGLRTIVLLCVAATSVAGVPIGTYPECGPDNRGACPSDFGDWSELSWIPDAAVPSVREAELALGSGISLDEAFRHSTGSWDVTIAILDSGIEWQERRLASKIRLNVGELPQPLHADGALVVDWDLDGNGIVNVDDYREDPRVAVDAGVDPADGFLDPSDLIHTFSDGVDDDGNGFVDDIAGWDFFGGDNDPYAQLEAGFSDHGTGVMKEAAAGGEDGGGIGVCPNCSILPVRVGDAFITDGDRIGLAVTFATHSGARVIGMAVGAITHPDHARDAVQWADREGVVLVGAAGDENSYHHNFPAVQAPILYVHSIRADNAQEDSPGVYSFLNHWNCNNYGPRVDLAAPSGGCATGAVAKTSGAAGLVASAAHERGWSLAPAEVRSLLLGNVDEIWLTADELEQARTYPSKQGWDAFFGYGRLNVGQAVGRVAAGEIPPVARLVSPEWFAWPGRRVVVRGAVGAREGDVAWSVAVGQGAEPADWVEVASGSRAADGVLVELDAGLWGVDTTEPLFVDGVVDRMYRAHESLFTVRLRAEANGQVSEDRRGFWVVDDPDALPGFPIDLGASSEASPNLADIDGDGVYEVVVAASGGTVHVLDGSGSEIAGFPVRTSVIPGVTAGWGDAAPYRNGDVQIPHEGVVATPAVGDIDGDGAPEIVVATLSGGVFAWNHDGTPVDGFPVRILGRAPEAFLPGRSWDNGVLAAASLGDIDGDGALEVVVAGADQRLYAWSGAGAPVAGYPIDLCQPTRCDDSGARIVSAPALGDIDGDGDLDAALGTNEVPIGAAGLLYIVDLTSAEVWPGFPLARSGLINESVLPVVGEGHPSSVALADLDGDGDLELASNPMLSAHGPIHHDGSTALDVRFTADSYGADATFLDGALITMVNNPAFADLDGDGVVDFITGGAAPTYLVSLALTTVMDYQHAMGAWSGADGAFFPGFPTQNDDVAFLSAPAVADVTGDGAPEVVFASGGYFVNAVDAAGQVAAGWPKHAGGWVLASPAIGDIDGDGYLDVVVATREGWLFAWSTQGRADAPVQWSSVHHDPTNSGNYGVQRPLQAGPAEGGCGSRAVMLWLPLLVFAGGRRRRRYRAS